MATVYQNSATDGPRANQIRAAFSGSNGATPLLALPSEVHVANGLRSREQTLYTLFLPLNFNDGSPVPQERFDKALETIVEIAGGATVLPHSTGLWISLDSKCYEDQMVPILILVSDNLQNHIQFRQAIEILCTQFQQEMLFCYRQQVFDCSVEGVCSITQTQEEA